jgi:hypothetical protein
MTAPALRTAATPQQPQKLAVLPSCTECGNPHTEPLQTMRLHTSAADTWFRCDECQHVFSIPCVDVR